MFDPDIRENVFLVHIASTGRYWNAARWGSGRGIWQRDVLYVTDRERVFGVHVRVPGRSQPVDAMP